MTENQMLGAAIGGLVTGISSLAFVVKQVFSGKGTNGNGHSAPCQGLREVHSDVKDNSKEIGKLTTKQAVTDATLQMMSTDMKETKTNVALLVKELVKDRHSTDHGG